MAATAQFSNTARMDKAVQKAVAGIDETAWVPIKYPEAISDEQQQRWMSDAQVAETTYTAFTSKGRKQQVTARLIVRRVKRLNPRTVPQGEDELFTVYRRHAVFTNSTEPMLIAEAHHRDHAIVAQVIADLKGSALAHFPSARMNANAAWLTCAVIAYNLSRAAGVLAGGKLAKARTSTIRTKLISIPARISSTARTYTLHLPRTLAARRRSWPCSTPSWRRRKRSDPPIRPPPRPSPALPGHPDDRSGDAVRHHQDKKHSRSTSGIQDQLPATRWIQVQAEPDGVLQALPGQPCNSPLKAAG